jgi:hypothetical protein
MRIVQRPDVTRTHLTEELRAQPPHDAIHGGDTGELRVEELEERVAPRVVANHNETLLVDAYDG